MGREELKLKILNGSARLIAGQEQLEEKDVKLLIEGVMEHMMETGTELLHFDNLYVQVNFEEATILSFLIDDGQGRMLDLERFTTSFVDKIEQNRKKGLRRLVADISVRDEHGRFPGTMIFSKN